MTVLPLLKENGRGRKEREVHGSGEMKKNPEEKNRERGEKKRKRERGGKCSDGKGY